MKLVIAAIQPTKLDAVRRALSAIEVERLTVCDAQAFAHRPPAEDIYRGQSHTKEIHRRVELQIVVNDDFLERTLAAIAEVARTGPQGTLGDGKVFVLPVVETIDLAAGTRGPGAV